MEQTFDFETEIQEEEVSFDVEPAPVPEVDVDTFSSTPEVEANPVLGVSSHPELSGRDLPNQHPMSAISGLEEVLETKQPIGDYATKEELNGKQDTIEDLDEIRDGAEKGGTAVQPTRKINNKPLSSDIILTNVDVGALPSTTKYGSSLSLLINEQTYVLTAQLKDQNGENLGKAQTVDLPLETMVVGAEYDETTKEIVLTLQNGESIRFSVADLVSGLQPTISDLDTIRSGAEKGRTAVQPEELSAVAKSGNYADLNGKPTIGNATITIKQGGETKGSFALNQTTAQTIELDAGGGGGEYLPLTGGTLSGDLKVNNTFLVGKKSGYVRVAYVDMPAGAYVNSGYYGNLDSEIMLVGSAQASSNIIQFAGAITSTTKAIAINGGMTQNTTTRFGNRYVTNASRLQVGQKVTITTNKSTYTMVDDNGSVLYTGDFGTPSEFTTATPILVGKADGSSNAVAKRIYAFIATENGEEKVALYPAKRVLDGVVGLYDIVSNTFLPNIGTGTFTGGEEIDDKIDFPAEYLVGDSITDAITFSDNGVEIKKEYDLDNDSYNIPNTKFVHKVVEPKYNKAGGVVYGDIYGNQEIHSHDVLSVGVKNDGTAVSGITIYDKVQHTSFATASTSSSHSGPRIQTGLSCKTTTKVILSYKPLMTQYQIAASARMLFLNDNQMISWEYGDGEVQTIVLQSEYNDSDKITIGAATESYELYSVVILEGTKCVAHFVPATQGTTKGMYDLQRKTFYNWAYGNSSATNVTYGATVNPVGSYSIGTVSDVGLNFMTNGENRVLIGNDGVVRLNQEVSSTATGKEVITAEWVLAKLAELGG